MKFPILLIFSECNFSESLQTEKPTNTGILAGLLWLVNYKLNKDVHGELS